MNFLSMSKVDKSVDTSNLISQEKSEDAFYIQYSDKLFDELYQK